MIKADGNLFALNTKNTSYVFRVNETGQLEHMHYGRLIHLDEPSVLVDKHAFGSGCSVIYDEEHPNVCLENLALETSGIGKGDVREPMIEVICNDGSTTTDFVYESYEVLKGKVPFKTLPYSYDEDDLVETLNITMKDKNHGFTLVLSYYVYEDCDVITRSAKFINSSENEVRLTRMLSMLIDLDNVGYKVTSFHGGWAREMSKTETIVSGGKYVNSSFTGNSSNHTNPFFMVGEEDATEYLGEVYGFNLIYSGNHYSATEVSSFGRTRIVSGINPMNFGFVLAKGEEFEAPEAVMTFSREGYTRLSHNMHDFVREHITRGEWKKKERPILINSWEAAYFNFTESSLVKLAKEAKELGMELFVMDDGWFGNRDDDKHALGDWNIINEKKLPHGLEGLSKKINDLGLSFGLWVEPEMVNVQSKLYEAHKDWAIDIPGMNHSEGRNQRILDFCNPDVTDYIIERLREILSTPGLTYIKWDMNRNFSDYYSKYLPANKQQEVSHRYIMGLYKVLDTVTREFPHVLFEGCASGGNRFDLGALCYYPQIWGSDNTDAVCRLKIQDGLSYGYPQSTYGAHVSSCPNHQTLRVTPLESRFAVASFGVLGYECNLCDMKKEDLAAIKAQVELYKQYRKTLQFGDFYRMRSDNIYQWNIVDKDKNTSVGLLMQREVQPGQEYLKYNVLGLDKDKKYHFFGRKLEYNVKAFGDLVNTVSPIHIKQDSLVHNVIAKFVKMPGEYEDYIAYGDTLESGGVKLLQAYVGTGFSEEVRYFPDFGARLYFIEAEDN